MKLLTSATLSAALLQQANAGTINQVRITKIAINKTIGPMLFVLTDGTKSGAPSCHTIPTWTFVMPLNDKTDQQMMAILVSAQAAQTPVYLEGNNLCNTFGGVETLIMPIAGGL
ncbi:MAG: hypothetical protein ABI574_11985 [Burkholderiales bacterium]